MKRCHLCGREGERGYVEAVAVVILGVYGPIHVRDRLDTQHVTICAARAACNLRRGVS